MALGAAERGRPTMMFLTKEAVRLAVPGVAVGTACDGCPPLPALMDRYERAGGRHLVCPLCVHAKKIDGGTLIAGAEVGGTLPLSQWIGEGRRRSASDAPAPPAVPWSGRAPRCCPRAAGPAQCAGVTGPSAPTLSAWSSGTTAEYRAVQQPGQQYCRNTTGAST